MRSIFDDIRQILMSDSTATFESCVQKLGLTYKQSLFNAYKEWLDTLYTPAIESPDFVALFNQEFGTDVPKDGNLIENIRTHCIVAPKKKLIQIEDEPAAPKKPRILVIGFPLGTNKKIESLNPKFEIICVHQDSAIVSIKQLAKSAYRIVVFDWCAHKVTSAIWSVTSTKKIYRPGRGLTSLETWLSLLEYANDKR